MVVQGPFYFDVQTQTIKWVGRISVFLYTPAKKFLEETFDRLTEKACHIDLSQVDEIHTANVILLSSFKKELLEKDISYDIKASKKIKDFIAYVERFPFTMHGQGDPPMPLYQRFFYVLGMKTVFFKKNFVNFFNFFGLGATRGRFEELFLITYVNSRNRLCYRTNLRA